MRIWIDVKFPCSFACFSESSENMFSLADILQKSRLSSCILVALAMFISSSSFCVFFAKCVKCSAILCTLPKQLNPILRILSCP